MLVLLILGYLSRLPSEEYIELSVVPECCAGDVILHRTLMTVRREVLMDLTPNSL